MLFSLQRGSKHFSNLEHSFHGGRTSDLSGASGGQIGRLKYTVQFDYNIIILHTAGEHKGKGPGKGKGNVWGGGGVKVLIVLMAHSKLQLGRGSYISCRFC